MIKELPKTAYLTQLQQVAEEYENLSEENEVLKRMVMEMSNQALYLIDENEHLKRMLMIEERRVAQYE